MKLLTGSSGGNTGNWWPTSSIGKLNYRSTASLLLITNYTISSPADSLRWAPPDTSVRFLVPTPSISRLSQLLGFNDSRHHFLLRLFDLAYSFRLRLPLLVSAGFFLCHFFSIYFPRVEINVELDEEDDDEDDVELEIELDIEDGDTDADN